MRQSLLVFVLSCLFLAPTLRANEPPEAVDDAYDTPSDEAISVDAPGVLGNDSDPDGDPLTAVLEQPPHPDAEFQLFTDGGFEYRPPVGFVGLDTFTYVANDGTVDSNIATVVIDVVPGSSRQAFTDETAFRATLEALGLTRVREGFENEAVWGHVRSTVPDGSHTAPSVTHQGITWTSNNETSEVTTSGGAARRGNWGFYSLPHGDFGSGTDCHLPGNCSGGWIATGDRPLLAAGGWVDTNTPFAKLELILDGDAANPVDFDAILDTRKRFFGVIDPAGFLSIEFHELEGKAEDQKFIFGDDFSFAFEPAGALSLAVAGTCPGSVTLSVSGATPNSRVIIYAARRAGSTVLTTGPCAGVILDLEAARRLAILRTDNQGDGAIVRNTRPSQCGRFLQALDAPSCTTSNVDNLP